MKRIGNSLSELVFPVTCACCGVKTEDEGQYICNWCRRSRFEAVHGGDQEFLPESVSGLFSMWYFDKGGYLQQLLHNLKYNHLRGVGEELGRIVAGSFLRNSNVYEMDRYHPLIVPVPLHKSRKRKRGYNQARVLAEGFTDLTNWDLIDEKSIIRIKNTRTQTGLTGLQRSVNIRKAFYIMNKNLLENRLVVIIDDVFTTGATTFELADSIYKISSKKVMIITVAKA